MSLAGWAHRVAITIDKDDIDADLTDWTLVFDQSFNSVLTQVNGPLDNDGTRASIDGGGDVRFSSDSAGNTQLACDIRRWNTDNNPANAECEVAVKVPSVSSSTDTTFYMWWGKSGESQPGVATTYGQYNAYDSDYENVWIMANDPSSTNLVPRNAAGPTLTEQVGPGGSGFQSSDLITASVPIGHAHSFDGNYGTARAWWQASTSRDQDENTIEIVGKFNVLPQQTGFESFYSNNSDSANTGSYQLNWSSGGGGNGELAINHRFPGLTAGSIIIDSSPDTNWHHFGFKYHANTRFVTFIDGTQTNHTVPTGNIVANQYKIGTNRNSSTTNRNLNGAIAEIRISSDDRSDAWVDANYHNIFNTAGFLTWGSIVDSGEVDLSAAIAAQSDLSASMAVERTLSAAIDGVSNLDAFLSVERTLAAVIAAQSDLSASMVREIGFSGIITAISAVEAGLVLEIALSAEIDGQSGLGAMLTVITPSVIGDLLDPDSVSLTPVRGTISLGRTNKPIN
jgi:hypothetical protein